MCGNNNNKCRNIIPHVAWKSLQKTRVHVYFEIIYSPFLEDELIYQPYPEGGPLTQTIKLSRNKSSCSSCVTRIADLSQNFSVAEPYPWSQHARGQYHGFFCLFVFNLNGTWPWLVSLTTPVLTRLFPAKIVAGGKKIYIRHHSKNFKHNLLLHNNLFL